MGCLQAMLQLDGPGAYLLASDVDVSEAPARGSQKVGRLSAGEEVYVLEVVHRKGEKRVRGRVANGWISLLDTSEGYRWAHRQLAATNEWISCWDACPPQPTLEPRINRGSRRVFFLPAMICRSAA